MIVMVVAISENNFIISILRHFLIKETGIDMIFFFENVIGSKPPSSLDFC